MAGFHTLTSQLFENAKMPICQHVLRSDLPNMLPESGPNFTPTPLTVPFDDHQTAFLNQLNCISEVKVSVISPHSVVVKTKQA